MMVGRYETIEKVSALGEHIVFALAQLGGIWRHDNLGLRGGYRILPGGGL